MLGGYYLGQTYLGISGWTDAGTLAVQDATHGLTSDNVTLTQQHTIVVANAAHSLTSGNVNLIENKTLAVDNALHALTSSIPTLIVNYLLAVDNARHALTSSTPKLINWDELGLFYGLYTQRPQNPGGELQEASTDDEGLYIPRITQANTLEQTEVDSGGLYIPKDVPSGIL